MSKNKEPKDPLDDLPMGERLEMEQMIMDEAFENSYKIVTKRMTFEELANMQKYKSLSSTITVFDPTEEPDNDVIEDLILHFEDREEYEKCAELKKLLDVQL